MAKFSSDSSKIDKNLRNKTILSIVKPLFGFVKKLPQFTLTTENFINDEAKAVRKALLEAREPDDLLFSALPQACGLSCITDDETNKTLVKKFRKKLVHALSSLQAAYDDLVGYCEKLIKRSFAINIEIAEFRENLRYRALNLSSQVIEPRMKSFILASSDKEGDNKSWIESLLLIISNKASKSWTDDDVIMFETKLSNIARRFLNLEALQKKIAIPNKGVDARRITITYPDGDEIHQMLWIDRQKQENVEKIAEQIIKKYNLDDDLDLKQTVAAALIEKIFSKKSEISHLKVKELKKEYKVG